MSLPKPFFPLLALLAVVALAHLALLERLPSVLRVQPPSVVAALTTRTVEAPVAAVPAPPPPPPPSAVAPRPPARSTAPPRPENAPTAVAVAAAEIPAPIAPIAPPADPAPAAPEPPASEPAAPAPEPTASAPAESPVPLTHATVFAFPDPVRLLYTLTGEAKKMPYHARGELLWQHDGSRYQATLHASMLFLGSRTRTSSGSLTPEGLAPQRFADKWRTEQAAHFDQAQQRVRFSANTPDVVLHTAAQDQLSVILQIAGILAADPARYPPGAALAVQTVGPKDADTWIFSVEGPEHIYLPIDNMDSLKLTRKPRKAYDQQVEVWLAPAMGYLPVRLKITNANGDFVDQQLRGVEKP